MNRLKDIKRSATKEALSIELERRLTLIQTLGEPTSKYKVVDRRPMTPELIEEFHLALDPNSDSIRSVIPSSEKVRIRVGPSQYEIRYDYGLRADVNGPTLKDTSRDFCVHLIEAGKLYTRAEIDRMNNGFGLDVFQFAGGWWNNDGVIEPKCRHTWYQNIVIKQ